MHTKKTEAIVINSIDYGESDKIITFYTKELGRIRGMAKGAKRSKRRFQNTLEPFSYIKTELTSKSGSGLHWIHHATLIEGFTGIRMDIDRFIYGSLFLEMVDLFTGEGHPVSGLFTFFRRYLHKMNTTRRPRVLTYLFIIRLLAILGYPPYVSGCVVCEKTLPREGYLLFSHRDGGVLCPSCGKDKKGDLTVSQGIIKTLEYATSIPMERLDRLTISWGQEKEYFTLLKGFIRYHLDRELKSWSLLGEVSEGGLV